ncbi:MAG: hypothetical protein JO143_07670, partial [Acetobacteraceae bacterium]|nr:hypothetical protein [Acetobacteraceae bacterium]
GFGTKDLREAKALLDELGAMRDSGPRHAASQSDAPPRSCGAAPSDKGRDH